MHQLIETKKSIWRVFFSFKEIIPKILKLKHFQVLLNLNVPKEKGNTTSFVCDTWFRCFVFDEVKNDTIGRYYAKSETRKYTQ